MKKILFSVFLSVLSSFLFAQYSSNCEVSTVFEAEYSDLVHYLAELEMDASGTSDTLQVSLTNEYLDPIWQGLAAIYNVPEIPGYDEIFNIYCFGSSFYSYFHPNEVYLQILEGSGLTGYFQSFQIETFDSEQNDLLEYYGFYVDHYVSSVPWAILKTNQDVNSHAVAKILRSNENFTYVFLGMNVGDGRNVTYTKVGDDLYFDFEVGWEDCYAGCIYSYFWHYMVDINTCEVTFLGSEGDEPLEAYGSNCNIVNMNNLIVIDENIGCGNLTANFSSESDAEPIAWNWDFGDGSTSTEQNPSHYYDTPGDYSVTLVVENAISDNDSLTLDNIIHISEIPIVELGDETEMCGGEQLDAGAYYVSYLWNGVEGERYKAIYESGTYSVVVEDAYGCTATDQIEIDTVYPELLAEIETTPCSSLDLCDGVANAVISGGEEPYLVQWNSGIMSNPHNFACPATYCAWIYDVNGCVLELCGDVGVVGNQITANISYGYNQNLLFQYNQIELSLYKQVEEDIVLESQSMINTNNGTYMFYGLEDGNYFLESRIIYPENYNFEPVKCYHNAVAVNNADTISLESQEVFEADINHFPYYGSNGSNLLQGEVFQNDDFKNFLPYVNAVVIFQDVEDEEDYGIAITNDMGEYFNEDFLTNKTVKVFVSSFEYSQWIPAIIETEYSETYTLNFYAEDNIVYPEGWSGKIDILNNLEFEIFPNPADRIVSLSNVKVGSIVNIFDLSSKKVLETELQNDLKIDISMLVSGMYFVLISGEEGMGIKKLVVQ